MIIQTLLDTDLYKLTMMQGVYHQFSDSHVEYDFICRTPGIDFRTVHDHMAHDIDHLCSLRFTRDELNYLDGLGYFKKDFTGFLNGFSLNRNHLLIGQENGGLSIKIKGSWLETILFEVPLLSIINEWYYRKTHPHPDWEQVHKRLEDKISLVQKANQANLAFSFSDFGTRRRFSKKWHETIIPILKNKLPDAFAGTSNVALARRFDLTPVGTMAHEWLMACQAISPGIKDSQVFALRHWLNEYPDILGIALSDVAGFDAFLHDFDADLARAYSGCRQDSGDPYTWGDRLIDHYTSLAIDPKTKVAIFSDGLTFPKSLDIARYFKGRINTAFGIGTNLTNDVSGKPIQIVIKMTQCQGLPVAKLSDSPGKQSCTDEKYLARLTHMFKGDSQ